MQLNYQSHFGVPIVPVEKLQIFDTRRILSVTCLLWKLLSVTLKDVKASLRNMSAARDKWAGVLSIVKRMVWDKGERTRKICRCSQYWYCQQGRPPSRGCEYWLSVRRWSRSWCNLGLVGREILDLKRRIGERRIAGVMVEGIYMGEVLRTPSEPGVRVKKELYKPERSWVCTTTLIPP